MTIRTYKVTLDTKNAIAPEPVFLRQGDKTGAVVINATLMDNGSPVSLDGLTPMFKANTADGQAVIADSTGFSIVNAAGGEFTYQVPNALSSAPGKVTTAYFSFSDSSGSESTFDVAFIIKKAVDITKPQADDYITIIDGTIQSLQQKIDSMNTDIKTILNAYNQGNFYNKSDTDSKDAATLSSAEKYADSGDSNTLYNAKNYTDNSLSGIVALPETFTNLASIKAKYPSGKNGIMVAADDGHKYIWNGTEWQDAGAYQTNGTTLRSRPAVLITKGAVNINTVTKSLEFDGHYLAVSDGYEQYQLTQYANKSFTVATDGLLVFDTVGNVLKVVAAAINILDTDLEIGYLYFDKNKFWLKSIFTVNGVAYLPKRSVTNAMVTPINKPCLITAAQDIVIDTVNRKLIMPDIDKISLTYGLTVTNLADTLRGAEIDLSFNGNSSGWLFVNPFDKQFHTSFDEDLDENSYLLGAIWWDKLKFDLNFTFKVNGGDYYGMLQGRYGRCKTIAALGDSLTEGVTGTDESGAKVRHPYTEYLPQYTGCIVDNFGVGSSRVQLSEGAPVLSFVERIVDIPQHDYLILFGGMNDWRGSLPLGELADVGAVYDDISVCDTHTFTGALEYCINYWLNKFMDSNIFLCTIPLENRGATHSFAKNGLGLVQSDYNDKIKALSNRYSLPLIDMWQLGISPYNKAQSTRWMQDGMHYRSGGYEKMAQYIAGEIKRHVY